MSRLRARCPDCRTLTAVALGPEYECHSCGRAFAAGLVRVPRAWGEGGDAMGAAATLALPYPETAVISEETLQEQTLAVATALPERPLVLGGCCCAHVGAVEALAARHEQLALVWLDAHGDLHTPETSPSGDAWGMPLRMLLDGGTIESSRVALVGARSLEPAEEEFVARSGIHRDREAAIDAALSGGGCAYVAFDVDVLEPGEVAAWLPEPGGPTLVEAEALLRRVAGRAAVVGMGFSGLVPDEASSAPLARLARAAGL